MNIVNRVLVSVLALLVLVGVVVVLLVALEAVRPATLAPMSWAEDQLAAFSDLTTSDRAWTVGVCLALALLALILLYLELQPALGGPTRLTLRQDGQGVVTVTYQGVREVIAYEARQVPGVRAVGSQIEEAREGLRITCRAEVDPLENLSELSDQLQQRIRTAVEQHLGHPVAAVQVHLEVREPAGRVR